jgi:ATP-dependent Clp protease ATP-binding subunit ClpA
VQECLGHAFISRVNEPVVFAPFTRATALTVAENEIRSLIGRVCGASQVTANRNVAEHIVDTLVKNDTGARGIIDATRTALCDALRTNDAIRGNAINVSLKGQDVVIEASADKTQ